MKIIFQVFYFSVLSDNLKVFLLCLNGEEDIRIEINYERPCPSSAQRLGEETRRGIKFDVNGKYFKKMVIKVKEIKELFDRLFEQSISREEAQKQAIEVREKFDIGNLEFYPKKDEDKIWDAVQFIELYAEKVDIGTYVYSENDLLNYIKGNGWK